jgi:hypothetical protein
LLKIKYVFWFSLQLLSETFLILRKIQRDTVINVHRSWIFSTEFRKILKYQISWKSVPWEPSSSIPTEGGADRRDEAYRRCSPFCESAQELTFSSHQHFKIGLNYSQTFRSHCAVNILRLRYKKRSIRFCAGNNRCLFWDPINTQMHSVGNT